MCNFKKSINIMKVLGLSGVCCRRDITVSISFKVGMPEIYSEYRLTC